MIILQLFVYSHLTYFNKYVYLFETNKNRLIISRRFFDSNCWNFAYLIS